MGGPLKLHLLAQSALTLAIVTLLGPLVYRLAYQRLADATVLVLLIVSVGVHFALTGLGLVSSAPRVFATRASGTRASRPGALDALGPDDLHLCRLDRPDRLSLALLRPHAARQGAARDRGQPPRRAPDGHLDLGRRQAQLRPAAFIGALSGLLIGPTTTIFYDSGFLIGLKGFVAAIFGGLASYPAAALGALLVGVLESFSSFCASAFKEVIVFTLIIPVLLWRSFQHGHEDEEE